MATPLEMTKSDTSYWDVVNRVANKRMTNPVKLPPVEDRVTATFLEGGDRVELRLEKDGGKWQWYYVSGGAVGEESDTERKAINMAKREFTGFRMGAAGTGVREGNPPGDDEDNTAFDVLADVQEELIRRKEAVYPLGQDRELYLRVHSDGDVSALVRGVEGGLFGAEVIVPAAGRIQDVIHYALHHNTLVGWEPDSDGYAAGEEREENPARYELFYSDGGHGGPYHGMASAVARAQQLIAGRRGPAISISIRPHSVVGVGGYGPPLVRVSSTKVEALTPEADRLLEEAGVMGRDDAYRSNPASPVVQEIAQQLRAANLLRSGAGRIGLVVMDDTTLKINKGLNGATIHYDRGADLYDVQVYHAYMDKDPLYEDPVGGLDVEQMVDLIGRLLAGKRTNPSDTTGLHPLYSVGPWRVYEVAAGRLKIENTATGHGEYPVIYHTGKVGYDRPEELPAHVKQYVARYAARRRSNPKSGYLLVIEERGYSWAGRPPIRMRFATEEAARANLLTYVRSNWDAEMGDMEMPEDPDDVVSTYFDNVDEEYDIHPLGEAARRRRSNPASSAASKYEEFHGVPSEQEVVVTEDIHYHGNLAGLGDLVEIVIKTPSGYKAVLDFDGAGTLLCCSEDGKQLYLRGGDQAIDLAAIKMSGDEWLRDSMVLGSIHKMTYRTAKKFDNLQVLDYEHKLGEESGVRPDLIYDVLNNQLSVAGGQYDVRPEGVVN